MKKEQETPARVLLENAEKNSLLVERLKAVMEAPFYPKVQLQPKTKAHYKEFLGEVQNYLDELSKAREKALDLIAMIPNQNHQAVLKYRYGLNGKPIPWLDMPGILNYEVATCYRYHRAGIKFLDQLLQEGR